MTEPMHCSLVRGTGSRASKLPASQIVGPNMLHGCGRTMLRVTSPGLTIEQCLLPRRAVRAVHARELHCPDVLSVDASAIGRIASAVLYALGGEQHGRAPTAGSTCLGWLFADCHWVPIVRRVLFWLPLYVSMVDCCAPRYFTVWNLSLNVLSHFQGAPVPDTFLLLLCYLPLLAAVTVVGCSVGFLVHPQRTFAIWSSRGWLIGSIALVLLLPFLFLFIRPAIGYLGMLFSYGLFWAGNRIFLTAHP
jgi:hypothetical protein